MKGELYIYMGQVYSYNYIYHVVGSGNDMGYSKPQIDGWYSQWNSQWSPMACISGNISDSNPDVMATLAYTTGAKGPVSYKNISYLNNAINGTNANGARRYTISLDNVQKQRVNEWLKGNTTGFHTEIVTSGLLPSSYNNQNMIVFNLDGTKQSKILIGLRGYYHNAKFTAQQSYNGCLQYGRRDLPNRYMYINATYCGHSKPNGNAYLYDYNTNLYSVSYKYTSSLISDYTNNMRDVCNSNQIPWNYQNSNISTSFPYKSTTTYRVIQYDAASGSAIIENAISPYYAAGLDVKNSIDGLQTPIIICCNEIYYNTKILNLIVDNCVILKHSYNYVFDPQLIPTVGNSGITNSNGNVYGYGHVFYSVNYPYCIWLSDTQDPKTLLISRSGNQVSISFNGYQTTMQYMPVITIAILSNDPNGVCYYTINQITQGFDKSIKIYPFNPTTPLVNTSALHNALTLSIQGRNSQSWTINTSTATISGVFETSISNDTLCVTLNNIDVNYLQYTYDSVNFSIDVVPLNQQNNEYVIKTAISTSDFVDNISSTVTVPWQRNGVNVLLPCSARTYSNGTYIGVESLSVNQNTFGLALQYLEKDTTPDDSISNFFDPFLEYYFGSNDTIVTGDENDSL